jgi:hypothetical protein
MLETAWSDVRKDQAENALIQILSDSLKNDIDKHIISAMKSHVVLNERDMVFLSQE